jgi:VIT1/CCC1 family predicted Fe2+/Mn2+ transporter
MPSPRRHAERHRTDRIGWLRAAVLGANDGIVSTASLIVGVAATGASRSAVIVAATAGLVAGAMSMAAGEYVSVSSQADTERADISREERELATDPVSEHEELARIYESRGVSAELAHQVAGELMAHDALGAHSRDELGISHTITARPLQAALSSAVSFTVGALLPVVVAALTPTSLRVWMVALSSLVFLAALGVVSARLGGAKVGRAALRVTVWGAAAMLITALIGKLVGTVV